MSDEAYLSSMPLLTHLLGRVTVVKLKPRRQVNVLSPVFTQPRGGGVDATFYVRSLCGCCIHVPLYAHIYCGANEGDGQNGLYIFANLLLSFLSFLGEGDLLKYTRHLNIRIRFPFSPYVLEPHLQHLRSLDKTHTLTICLHNAPLWRGVSNTHFTRLDPTLTTLVFLSPSATTATSSSSPYNSPTSRT